MKVIVDTSVWSLAFRRQKPAEDGWVSSLRKLVQQGQVVMLGPVRQEVL
jgi:hypothetical protein